MNYKKLVIGVFLGGVILSLLLATSLQYKDKRTGGQRAVQGEAVGLVRIEGVLTEEAGNNWLSTPGNLQNILDNLRKAQQDTEVQVVLLRINSPGGSGAAGQEIAREVQRLKEAGKTVVVSMGETAASAGYLIAAGADRIVANPATLTGSIGVYMEFANYQELFDKLGIESEIIKSGPYKDMGSYSRPLTEEERKIAQSMVNDTYQQFIDAVAAGRKEHISREQLQEIADGRVLTGRQAQELGLVDDLGNFYDAVQIAAELAGLKEDPPIKEYGPRSRWSFLIP